MEDLIHSWKQLLTISFTWKKTVCKSKVSDWVTHIASTMTWMGLVREKEIFSMIARSGRLKLDYAKWFRREVDLGPPVSSLHRLRAFATTAAHKLTATRAAMAVASTATCATARRRKEHGPAPTRTSCTMARVYATIATTLPTIINGVQPRLPLRPLRSLRIAKSSLWMSDNWKD